MLELRRDFYHTDAYKVLLNQEAIGVLHLNRSAMCAYYTHFSSATQRYVALLQEDNSVQWDGLLGCLIYEFWGDVEMYFEGLGESSCYRIVPRGQHSSPLAEGRYEGNYLIIEIPGIPPYSKETPAYLQNENALRTATKEHLVNSLDRGKKEAPTEKVLPSPRYEYVFWSTKEGSNILKGSVNGQQVLTVDTTPNPSGVPLLSYQTHDTRETLPYAASSSNVDTALRQVFDDFCEYLRNVESYVNHFKKA